MVDGLGACTRCEVTSGDRAEAGREERIVGTPRALRPQASSTTAEPVHTEGHANLSPGTPGRFKNDLQKDAHVLVPGACKCHLLRENYVQEVTK